MKSFKAAILDLLMKCTEHKLAQLNETETVLSLDSF